MTSESELDIILGLVDSVLSKTLYRQEQNRERKVDESLRELELIAKDFVDGLLVSYLPIVIKTISSGVKCRNK
jgi:hypothetical protein